MKLVAVLRYILLPAAVFAAGTVAGVEYAKRTYVSRDRKFIESEVLEKEI